MASIASAKVKDSVDIAASKESQESARQPNSSSEMDKEINETQMGCGTSRDPFTRRNYWKNIWLPSENSKMSEVDFRQQAEKLKQTGISPDKIWEKLHTHGQCPGPVIGLTI
ncbi:hypothetical protein CHS0354_006019 [Potamilus streckersoni]|uniref:Uncharacterized protein n=1 Tax=Potamilus streckersoni TaxID=2493646 RepID=A0AAE0VNK3_9BIVA|nr:hypothetical protein CHS0354_006019 [Potamilus streckersoni]